MKTVLWERQDETSLEFCQFVMQGDRPLLQGYINWLSDGAPTHVAYTIECDPSWHTRSVSIQQTRNGQLKTLQLSADDGQRWAENHIPVPFADGLFDVDLEICPATNTLPIRRLNLEEGQTADVTAVWVRFPDLRLEPLAQRYTRIGQNLYHYEAPSLDFEAQLEVDDDGLIVHYEGLWRRVGTGESR